MTVLDSVAQGIGYSELSEKFGIGKSTITTLKKNEAKIREFASTLESKSMSGSQKVKCLAKDDELNQALYLWFVQKRGIGMHICGTILCAKAKQFNEQLHAQEATTSSFIASFGWLWRFCNRHGNCGLRLQDEKLSADAEVPEPWTRSLNKLLASDKATESDQQPDDADAHKQSAEALARGLDHTLSPTG